MMTIRRLFLPAVLLIAALLALSQLNQHLILASDNAAYIVVGQALALGRGYVMVNEPSAPPMNLYPWGYPALLAAVLRLSGSVADPLQAVIPMKLVALAFYLASLPVMYALLRKQFGRPIASLTTLLFAVNPAVLSLATEILSETLFVFLALLALLLADRYTLDEKSRRLPPPVILALCGLSLIAAYYVRTAALALLLAAPLYLVLKRRVRAGLALGVFLALLALPWFLRSSAAPTADTPFFARSYIHQVLAQAPYSDQTVTPGGLVVRIVQNSLAYATNILPDTIFPHLSRLGPLAPVLSALIALLLVLGFALQIRRGLHVGEVAVAVYWLLLSLFVWVLGFRYIIVILPFAFTYLLAAVQWLVEGCARVLAGRGRRFPAAGASSAALALLVVAAVLALSAVTVDVRRAERNLRITLSQSLAQVYAADPEWTRYLQAASWLSAHTPGEAVVMARKPDLLYLLTHRRTLEYPYTQDTATLLSALQRHGVCYVLEDPFTWTRTTEIYLAPAMRGQPSAFSLVYQSQPPPARVWQTCP